MKRPNLTVETEAQTTRVLFEGKRAVGVEFMQKGEKRTATTTAGGEVILAAGAVASPQILEVSGIGPGAVLKKHGIKVIKDLKGVGENLQDHYMIGCQWRLKPDCVSVNELSRGPRLVGEILKYLAGAQGPAHLRGGPRGGLHQVPRRTWPTRTSSCT